MIRLTPPHTPAVVRRTRVAATLSLIVSLFLASPASASNEVCSFAHDTGSAVAADRPAGRDVAVEHAPLRSAVAPALNRVLSPQRSDPARREARSVALAMTAAVASVAPMAFAYDGPPCGYDVPVVSRVRAIASIPAEAPFPQLTAGGGKAASLAVGVEGIPMTPAGSLVTPRGTIGFTDDAVASAYQGMRSGGGHASRHLVDAGLIPNSGSLSSRVALFEDLTSPILRSPSRTFDWRLGDTATRAFAGEAGGQRVVVFVAKEGPYQGRVVSAVVSDSGQIAQWGL